MVLGWLARQSTARLHMMIPPFSPLFWTFLLICCVFRGCSSRSRLSATATRYRFFSYSISRLLIVMHDLGGMGLCPQNPVASWGKLQSIVDTALNLATCWLKLLLQHPHCDLCKNPLWSKHLIYDLNPPSFVCLLSARDSCSGWLA